MRILSPCQAAALLASPVLCLWELPGCQPQGAVAVPLTTRALGALYLASPASAFVTGSVLEIHGGITSANLDLGIAGL